MIHTLLFAVRSVVDNPSTLSLSSKTKKDEASHPSQEIAPPKSVRAFTSSCFPNLACETFVLFVARNTCSDVHHIVVAFALMERYAANLRGSSFPEFLFTPMNFHRYFAVAILMALKSMEDVPMPNKMYAAACGMNLAELNVLEILFLEELHWRMLVGPEECRNFLCRCGADSVSVFGQTPC